MLVDSCGCKVLLLWFGGVVLYWVVCVGWLVGYWCGFDFWYGWWVCDCWIVGFVLVWLLIFCCVLLLVWCLDLWCCCLLWLDWYGCKFVYRYWDWYWLVFCLSWLSGGWLVWIDVFMLGVDEWRFCSKSLWVESDIVSCLLCWYWYLDWVSNFGWLLLCCLLRVWWWCVGLVWIGWFDLDLVGCWVFWCLRWWGCVGGDIWMIVLLLVGCCLVGLRWWCCFEGCVVGGYWNGMVVDMCGWLGGCFEVDGRVWYCLFG